MHEQIRNRKLEHIEWMMQDSEIERSQSGFDQIRLIHRALPDIDYDEVECNSSFLSRDLSMPLLISSMTGGDHPQLIEINRHLALAAQEQKVALAVGSMRIALERAEARESFNLRRLAPDIPLLANLGAIQLNYGCGLDECRRLVDYLEADALILHLNPLQELIQPEGNRNFKNLLAQIEQLVHKLPVPLVVKEVGCGIGLEDMSLLAEAGVQWIDVAGRGGTSWSRIEAHRAQDPLGFRFQDWGLTTPQALKMARQLPKSVGLIASGGVRHGIDVAKSLVLGANLVGMAQPFLKPAMQNEKAVIDLIEILKRELKVAMFLMGQKSLSTLIGQEQLLLKRDQL